MQELILNNGNTNQNRRWSKKPGQHNPLLKMCSHFFYIRVVASRREQSHCISKMRFLIDGAVYSEHGKPIKRDFKPGSVERSIHHLVTLRL
jgi:hypothetical protein